MTYAVIWRMPAIRELAVVERAATDPAAVRAAANRIDYALRRAPHELGESREPGYRLWYEDVLGVRYHIDDAQKRVEVVAAGPARRR